MAWMEAKEYMRRVCLCGHERGVHMHGQTIGPSGEMVLTSLPCGCCQCACFIDEFERELGGCPADNAHLAPLMQELLPQEPGPDAN